ncbi:MAG TPA: hypothetical protein VD973_12555 [Symbiobacteriaceae bacterium]|nr:hypothetical protein [Symbiobacteriaceae bacterium]
MRTRYVVVLLTLLTLVFSLLPRPAAALSCMHPKDQLPSYTLLVEGKVTQVSAKMKSILSGAQPQSITVAVKRYFKGEGPAELKAVYDGLGWEEMKPVGSELIMGFYFDEVEKVYKAGACSLMMNAQPSNDFEKEMLTLIGQQFGEGKAPTGGPAPVAPTPNEPAGRLGTWLLWAGIGAIILLAGGIMLTRRAKSK